MVQAAAKSVARSIGSTVGREIIRGVLGSILGARAADKNIKTDSISLFEMRQR